MMIRNKRILEDLEEREDFFPKAADDILTKKDQAPKHIEVSTDGNPVLNQEGEK